MVSYQEGGGAWAHVERRKKLMHHSIWMGCNWFWEKGGHDGDLGDHQQLECEGTQWKICVL